MLNNGDEPVPLDWIYTEQDLERNSSPQRLYLLDLQSKAELLRCQELYLGLEWQNFDLRGRYNQIYMLPDFHTLMRNAFIGACIVPTPSVVKTIRELLKYNGWCDILQRKHFLEELPFKEYEYTFRPHIYSQPLFVLQPGTTEPIRHNAPYKGLLRIRADAHPMAVLFSNLRNLLGSRNIPAEIKDDVKFIAMNQAYFAPHWVDYGLEVHSKDYLCYRPLEAARRQEAKFQVIEKWRNEIVTEKDDSKDVRLIPKGALIEHV